jgi:hypothetical protein
MDWELNGRKADAVCLQAQTLMGKIARGCIMVRAETCVGAATFSGDELMARVGHIQKRMGCPASKSDDSAE